jgi:ribosomal protein S18 acetylase RimI-like enzyme
MTTIRPMQEADLDAVRSVDAAAFTAWWRQLTGRQQRLPPRTRANVASLLEKDPKGCFVAEEDGQVLGLIFSRTWGSVGWPGTFAVLPEHQGRGIGKLLLQASLRYLRQDPHRVVGLETMPDSSSNLGLYLKHGFRLSHPTLLLRRRLDREPPGEADLERWSRADDATRRAWLRDLREVTNGIRPGLDYTKEITATDRHGFGETLVLTDGDRAIGFVSVWLTVSREGSGGGTASVQVAALDAARTDSDTLRRLLSATEHQACTHQSAELVVPVNARFARTVDQLLDAGYRVGRMSARMVLADTDPCPPNTCCVNLSRWAG